MEDDAQGDFLYPDLRETFEPLRYVLGCIAELCSDLHPKVLSGQESDGLFLIGLDHVLRKVCEEVVELTRECIRAELIYRIDYYLRRQRLALQYGGNLLPELFEEAVLLDALIYLAVKQDHTFTPSRISAAPAAHVLMSSGATLPIISRYGVLTPQGQSVPS